jgi:hypothetical protein
MLPAREGVERVDLLGGEVKVEGLMDEEGCTGGARIAGRELGTREWREKSKNKCMQTHA